MAKEPLVSVCVPAHNVERFLAEAIGSILGQSYRELEVVLIDDGSTDGTAEVIGTLSDPRLRALALEPSVGGFEAMNRAIGAASGELVAVYHADDVYEPEIVAREVAYLQRHPRAGAVFCLDHYIDAGGRIFGGTDLPRELAGRDELGYEQIFPFLLRNKNVLLRCPTFMTRRSVLDEVGLFDPAGYGIAADLELWLRILRRYPIGILPERLMRYRVSDEQWSSRYERLRTEEERYFAVMDRYLEQDRRPERPSAGDMRQYRFHRSDDEAFRAANLVILGRPEEARGLLRKRYSAVTYLLPPSRRKLRALGLRTLTRTGLRLGLGRPLARLLAWSEYRGRALSEPGSVRLSP
jgi:glycosyltransferase involved in cell wall biosynthesis